MLEWCLGCVGVSCLPIGLFPNDVTAHLIITSCPDVSGKLHQYIVTNRVHLLISISEDDAPGAKIAYPSAEVLTRVMRLGLESDSSHYFCDL